MDNRFKWHRTPVANLGALLALAGFGATASAQTAEPTGFSGFISFTEAQGTSDILSIVDLNIIGLGVNPKLTVPLQGTVTNTSNRRAMMAPLETKIESVPIPNGAMWFVPTHTLGAAGGSSRPSLETVAITLNPAAPGGIAIVTGQISLGGSASSGGPYDILQVGSMVFTSALDFSGNLTIHGVNFAGTLTPTATSKIALGVGASPFATSMTFDVASGNLIVPTVNGVVVLSQTGPSGLAVAQTITFPAGEQCGTNVASGFTGPNVHTLVAASLDPTASVAGSYALIDPAGIVPPIVAPLPLINGTVRSELTFGHNDILVTSAPNGQSTATILIFDGVNLGGSAAAPGAIVQIRNNAVGALAVLSTTVPTAPFGDPEPTIAGGVNTGPAIVMGSGSLVDSVIVIGTGANNPIGAFSTVNVPAGNFFSVADSDRAYSLPNSNDVMLATRTATGTASLDSYTTRPGPIIGLNPGSYSSAGVAAGLPGVVRTGIPGLDLPVYGQGFAGANVVGLGGVLAAPPVYLTAGNLAGTPLPGIVTVPPPAPASVALFHARRVGFSYTNAGTGTLMQVVPTRLAGPFQIAAGSGGAILIHITGSTAITNVGPAGGSTVVNSELSML